MYFIPLKHIFYTTQVEIYPSNFAFGGILLQMAKNDKFHLVAFNLRIFLEGEINYRIYNKELLLIVDLFQEYHYNLEDPSNPLNINTNHKNHKYFMSIHIYNRLQAP